VPEQQKPVPDNSHDLKFEQNFTALIEILPLIRPLKSTINPKKTRKS